MILKKNYIFLIEDTNKDYVLAKCMDGEGVTLRIFVPEVE